MFHLKETESSLEFSGRVTDVFAALGTGSIKIHPESSTDRRELSQRPDFDKQQMARAVRSSPFAKPPSMEDNDDARDFAFKRPPAPIPRRGNNDVFKRLGRRAAGSENSRSGRHCGPAPDRLRIAAAPDHRRNPQHWTKYSLEDVTTDQLSDRSNTSAALDFLKLLKRNKAVKMADNAAAAMSVEEEEEEEGPAADLSQPITFRKPQASSRRPKQAAVRRNRLQVSTEETSTSEEPLTSEDAEGEVDGVSASLSVGVPDPDGQPPASRKKMKKSAAAASADSSAIKLSHLDDEED